MTSYFQVFMFFQTMFVCLVDIDTKIYLLFVFVNIFWYIFNIFWYIFIYIYFKMFLQTMFVCLVDINAPGNIEQLLQADLHFVIVFNWINISFCYFDFFCYCYCCFNILIISYDALLFSSMAQKMADSTKLSSCRINFNFLVTSICYWQILLTNICWLTNICAHIFTNIFYQQIGQKLVQIKAFSVEVQLGSN